MQNDPDAERELPLTGYLTTEDGKIVNGRLLTLVPDSDNIVHICGCTTNENGEPRCKYRPLYQQGPEDAGRVCFEPGAWREVVDEDGNRLGFIKCLEAPEGARVNHTWGGIFRPQSLLPQWQPVAFSFKDQFRELAGRLSTDAIQNDENGEKNRRFSRRKPQILPVSVPSVKRHF